METPGTNATKPEYKSALFKELLAERHEILQYKWLESEKAGYDIGFDRGILDLIILLI